MAHKSNTRVDYTGIDSDELYNGEHFFNVFTGTLSIRDFTVITTGVGDGRTPVAHAFHGNRRIGSGFSYKSVNDSNGNYIAQSGRGLFGTDTLTVPSSHGAFVSLTDIIPAVQNDAYEKVFEQLRGKANVTVDLAEAKETKALLKNFILAGKRIALYRRNPAELIRDVLQAGSGGPRKWPSKIATTSSNAWMQYRYGIMPIVYSTYDILKTHVFSPHDGVTKIRARKTRKENSYAKISSNYLTTAITEEVSVRSQYDLYFRMDGKKHLYDWASLDPARIAWELFPLSFVGDWFVNVGQVLELIDNRRTFADSFLYGCETTTTRRKSFSSETKVENPGYPSTAYTAHRHNIAFTKTRTVLTQLPMPHMPSVQVNLNSKRFVDAAALIYQGFFSKKR